MPRPPAGAAAVLAAAMLAPTAAVADDALGAHVAATCATCHRTGAKDATIPALAGLDESKLTAALQAYRTGERTDALMQAVAASLSEEEVAAVAHFLATRPAP